MGIVVSICLAPVRRLVESNSAVVVKDFKGNFSVLEGPKFILRNSYWSISNAEKYIANDQQYIEIVFKDGKKDWIQGPKVFFRNPGLHESVYVKQLIRIEQNQILIVHQKDGKSENISGPRIYMPLDLTFEYANLYTATNEQYIEIMFIDGKKDYLVGPTQIFFDPMKNHSRITVLNNQKLKENEKGMIINVDGSVNYVNGPCSFIPKDAKFSMLHCYNATEKEFLKIKYKNGDRKNIRGSAKEFLDTETMESIEVVPAHVISGNECIIVYDTLTDEKKTQMKTTRKIVRGPGYFFPAPLEWLHEFRWTGSNKDVKSITEKTQKIPGALRFTNLRLVADQFYYNVENVRTSDDAAIICKIMIFYELEDASKNENIMKMLDSTLDPIGDFVNAVSADVIAFVSQLNFESFVEKTNQLNDLKTFPQLTSNASSIGYRIKKVVFRGYESSSKLEEMHSSHLEKRTQLRLKKEEEEKSQELTDYQLKKEMERSKNKIDMENEMLEHELQMSKKKFEEKLSQEKQSNDEYHRKMEKLKGLGVDLGNLMLEEVKKNKPEKLIMISGGEKSQTEGSTTNSNFAPQFRFDLKE